MRDDDGGGRFFALVQATLADIFAAVHGGLQRSMPSGPSGTEGGRRDRIIVENLSREARVNRIHRLSTASLALASLIAASAAISVQAASPVEETQTLISQGDLDGALKRIDRFLASSPQDAEGRFTRALILVKQNRNADAIKAFTDLTRDYPQLPEPYNNLAVLYAQSGDYEKARDALEAALATNPAYATAHENLGDIYAALAGAAYNRALALDASNTTTRYKLSLLSDLTAGKPAGNRTGGRTDATGRCRAGGGRPGDPGTGSLGRRLVQPRCRCLPRRLRAGLQARRRADDRGMARAAPGAHRQAEVDRGGRAESGSQPHRRPAGQRQLHPGLHVGHHFGQGRESRGTGAGRRRLEDCPRIPALSRRRCQPHSICPRS